MMKQQPCIMVVDDEPEIHRLIQNILEAEGFTSIHVTSGDSVIPLLDEHQPDLVLLDIMMPGLDGFAVLELIRQKSNVPVIMLTGRGEVSALRESIDIGADDYIRKPFFPQELVARIRAKLRRARPNQPILRGGENEQQR